ncbi:hypothetical protein HanRHA438_Chr08g0337241 [Helianthus annuus]|nr:hypothetical protein HanHA300_Chr08g0269561 [Helianthus annuus]KAJ0545666.1 hypothetical protein HanIR_Chr08g0352311 [Helianthus annuus]KAJ0552543.1 hypothetical protein HanHA89_Chr08g0286391 [Helianthus annuus]KAJ0718240.1 hypothetical protein HanLR1_Chr08g0268431 [Helianthus annuus]KAJ0721481.1 hypothetical protein HanOQP8_Chr08g0276011 [Helianthus annuus]
MMLTRMNRKARPVVREKNGEDDALWRIFDPGFKGKVEVLACADGEEGFNFTIRDGFRIPDREAIETPMPQGKGIVDNFLMCFVKELALLICLFDDLYASDLWALGDAEAKGVPEKKVVKGVRFRQKKKHEPAVIPPLVP